MRTITALLLSTVTLFAVVAANNAAADEKSSAIKVEIVGSNGKYQLLRGGKPYAVKGAGIEFGELEAFAANGGNSFRTWNTDTEEISGRELLDKAHKLDLTVSLNLFVMAERWGFDYNDEAKVAAQFERVKQEVLKYKDHPALLTWIIGNELNYNYKNPKVYDAVNDIAKMIKQVDPNHPTTTTLAGYSPEIIELLQTRAPALDFISIQLYGDLINLPRYIRRDNFTMPYFITEWGAIGHWEVGKTSWGAPIEQNSSQKAANYLKSYRQVIKPFPEQALGSYVFLWGQKQERTPTWYGMFTDTGEATETIDVMHYIWNNQWPNNRTPKLLKMELAGKNAYGNIKLKANKNYPAKVVVKDPDGDNISYLWQVRPESQSQQEGGDKEEIPPLLTGLIDKDEQAQITLKAPKKSGAYRLFVYAYDGQGHAAHANIPFYVR
ncbi:hypothetical protein J7384_00715 [Endozoicomonas sp. G2_1]|uniref:glycoside hydrolase family 2 TIM barrel-domain containing protein n=1 Tax=Endozoicomonas sp. G2_1 TaxID=2821091 RepID=UPI001ADBD167|nr:glycoside hydrolase family 2 TIM barrel-domain containing protein [Endozoicomonas sp. G2_1]MBO9488877.1 hypothetical protein [Endozoicomonas sp. G2_1]